MPGITAIVVKELRGRMRGQRAFVSVTVYVLLVAGFAWMVDRIIEENARNQFAFDPTYQSASIGRGIFTALMFLQTLMISVLAPASTAGAISSEREKQTLDLLAVTPISSVAIVLGKLLSALSWVFVLILASIPVTALVFVYGGVAPDDVVRGYVLLFVTAIAFGSLGTFFSALIRRSGAATGLTFVGGPDRHGRTVVRVGLPARDVGQPTSPRNGRPRPCSTSIRSWRRRTSPAGRRATPAARARSSTRSPAPVRSSSRPDQPVFRGGVIDKGGVMIAPAARLRRATGVVVGGVAVDDVAAGGRVDDPARSLLARSALTLLLLAVALHDRGDPVRHPDATLASPPAGLLRRLAPGSPPDDPPSLPRSGFRRSGGRGSPRGSRGHARLPLPVDPRLVLAGPARPDAGTDPTGSAAPRPPAVAAPDRPPCVDRRSPASCSPSSACGRSPGSSRSRSPRRSAPIPAARWPRACSRSPSRPADPRRDGDRRRPRGRAR